MALSVLTRQVPIERYFDVAQNTRCKKHFYGNDTMMPMTTCAAMCLSEPKCRAFTQYDAFGKNRLSCFLFDESSRCRSSSSSRFWVSGVRGLLLVLSS